MYNRTKKKCAIYRENIKERKYENTKAHISKRKEKLLGKILKYN